jgi:hypothetical protein
VTKLAVSLREFCLVVRSGLFAALCPWLLVHKGGGVHLYSSRGFAGSDEKKVCCTVITTQ